MSRPRLLATLIMTCALGCSSDPIQPAGAVLIRAAVDGEGCGVPGETFFHCDVYEDGRPIDGTFDDQSGHWVYEAQPSVVIPATYVTLEYRYKDATAFGYRVVAQQTLDPAIQPPSATQSFDLKYVREAAGSKWAGYAGWNGVKGHLETGACIQNSGPDISCDRYEADPSGLNRLPIAAFVEYPLSLPRGTPCARWHFDASGSNDPEAQPMTYKWQFSDSVAGTTITATDYERDFCAAGSYTARLLVDDQHGGIDALRHTFDVVLPPPNRAPTASVSFAENSVGVVGGACSVWWFDGSSSSDPDTDPLTYSWSFDGGVSQAGNSSLTRQFCSSGAHSVTLTVSDGLLSGASTRPFTVTPFTSGPPQPLSVDIVGPANVQKNASCTWSAAVSGGTAPYSYQWRRDGLLEGTSSTYTRVSPRGFRLTLYVTSQDGQWKTIVRELGITMAPVCTGLS